MKVPALMSLGIWTLKLLPLSAATSFAHLSASISVALLLGVRMRTSCGIETFLPDLEELHLLWWGIRCWKVSHVCDDRALVHASDRCPLKEDFGASSGWSLK